MPYPSNDKLPDAVKNALPAEAQDIWRNAFNSGIAKYPGDEERANKIAWGAVKNAGWKAGKEGEKWIKLRSDRDQIYSVWTSMKSRCSNANDKDYGRYGGRGITVCQRWIDSFDDFAKDMGERKPGETVERINNTGQYEPKNCKWVDRKTQAGNRGYEKTHEFDAEIFSVGVWNKDKYTDKDLEDMVKNFDALKETVKPPVKLGHNEKQIKDGQPSIGWVKALKKIGNKLIATLTQVPDLIKKAIDTGRYKRISSEVFWNYKYAGKTFNRVLAGVALLGADIPAVDNLEDLEAYLSQSTDKGSFDAIKAYAFETDEAGVIINTQNKGLSEMDEKEYKEKIAKLEAEKVESDRKTAEAEAEKKAAADKLALFEKEQETEKKKTQIEGIKTYCEKMVKAGKMLPYQRDLLIEDIDKRSYLKEDGHIFNFDMVKKLFEKIDVILDTGEHAHDKKDKTIATPADELEQKTQEYMEKHPKVDYQAASDIVFKKNPKLAKAYARDEGGDE